MARDPLVPRDVQRASSAWGDKVLQGHDPAGVKSNEGFGGVLRYDTQDAQGNGTTARTLLRDPPMPPKGEKRFKQFYPTAPGPVDERPINDAVGLEGQQMTVIEVVKHDGKYHLLLDGHRQPDQTNGKYWLPRFRLQKGGEREEDDEGTVAPCAIGVRLEDGEFMPISAHLIVKQRLVDKDNVLVDEVVSRTPLQPYSVNDLGVTVLAAPYPATFTRVPTVSILDNEVKRRSEFKAYFDTNGAIFEGLKLALSAFQPKGTSRGTIEKELFKELAKEWFQTSGVTTNYWRVVSKLLVGRKVYDYFLPPPTAETNTDGRWVHIPIDEFVLVMERITASIDERLLPAEMRTRGMDVEAVVLEWLLYGEEKLGELSGQQFDQSGIDAARAVRTRCEFTYTVEIVDEGRDQPTRFIINPLRVNAVHAGWLMCGYAATRKRLKKAIDKFKNTVEEADDDGISRWEWDQTNNAASIANSRRWDALRPNDAKTANGGWNVKGSLLFDLDRAEKQLSRLLGESPTPQNPEVLENLTDADADAVAPADADADADAVAPAVEFTGDDYAKYYEEQGRLYQSIVGSDTKTKPSYAVLRRFRDIHAPLVSAEARVEWNLLAFTEVKVLNKKPPIKPELVRRLPQYVRATTGGPSVVAVVPAPQGDALDRLIDAKSAVAAARVAMRTAAVVWPRMQFVAETNEFAFHFFELRARRDDAGGDAGIDADSAVSAVGTELQLHSGAMSAQTAADATRADATPCADEWQIGFATGDDPGGDAGVLRALGLPVSLPALAALHAFCGAVVFRAIRAGADATVANHMQSLVSRAQADALACADVVRLAYGTTGRRATLLDRRDIFFSCFPSAPTVRAALAHLPCWDVVQSARAARPTARPTASVEATLHAWPPSYQRQADEFAAAMLRLGRALRLHPLRMHDLAVQSLWINDNRFVDEVALGAQLPGMQMGLLAQFDAAVQCFLRLRACVVASRAPTAATVVTATTSVELALLGQVACWHPVALQGAAVQLGPARTALDDAAAHAHAPAPREFNPASLATMRVDLLADDPTPVSVDAISELVSRMTLAEDSARYHVPPRGTGEALPGDLSHAPRLRETAVFADAVRKARWSYHEACWRCAVVSTEAREMSVGAVDIQAVGVQVKGRSRHPYLVDRGPGVIRVHLAALPALSIGGDAPFALPETVLELLDALRAYAQAQQRPLAGVLNDRLRAMLWNVDRFVQAISVAMCTTRGVTAAVPLFLRLDEAEARVNDTEARSRVQSLVIAQAVMHTAFLSVPVVSVVGITENQYDEWTAPLTDLHTVMPLREVCAVLVALAANYD